MSTTDVCRKHSISNATFYKRKAKYGGLDVSEAHPLKVLEDENTKLKKLLAEVMLDNAMLKDLAAKILTPAAQREALAHLCRRYEVSQRRACSVLEAAAIIVVQDAREGSDGMDGPLMASMCQSWVVRNQQTGAIAWALLARGDVYDPKLSIGPA
jgi:putative transposase